MTLFLKEFLLFALTQVLGVFVVLNAQEIGPRQEIALDFTRNDLIVFGLFLILFIFIARRFSHRASGFYKFIFAVAIIFGSQAVLSLFFGVFWGFISAILLALLVFKSKIVLIHNLSVILAIAGIGAVFGLSITPLFAVFLLIFLSFYDIIAVYKTGHMVRMAKEMIKSRAIFGIVLPQKRKGWFESLENVWPGGEFMILGSGDIAMPLILVASIIPSSGLLDALIVMLASFVGLFLTFYLFISQKKRKPMAALPPIAVASIVGYLITFLL